MASVDPFQTSGPPAPDDRLSGANRLVWAVLALAAIAGLCLLRVRTHGDTTLVDVYSDPARYAGVPVDLATEAIVAEVDEQGFTLRELEREIRVRGREGAGGPVTADDVGRYVHVRGVFHAAADGATTHEGPWIEPLGVRVHRGRRIKIWLSLVPLAWVALLLLTSFRIDPSRLAVELRRRA